MTVKNNIYLILKEYDNKPGRIRCTSEREIKEKLTQITKANNYWKKKLGLAFPPFETMVNGKFLDVYAKGVTGFVRIDDINVEVKPKFLDNSDDSQHWRVALTKALLITNQQSMLDRNFTSSSESNSAFLDLMAETFYNSLKSGIEQGLSKSYKVEKELLNHYKGKYDTRSITSLFTHPHLIPCVYDEYTEDHLLNQLFKWTASELAKSVLSIDLSNRLIELENMISANNVSNFDLLQVENIYLSPQYNYLEDALQISKLLLQNKSLEHADGSSELRGFLWNSAVVYEGLIKSAIRNICRKSHYTFSDASFTFVEIVEASGALPQKTQLRTSPDVRIMDNGASRYLIDAKYKVWTKQPKNEDIYQVMAGARVVDCPMVVLMYPKTKQNEDILIYNIRGRGNPLVLGAVFVDISLLAESQGYTKFVNSIEIDLRSFSQCYYSKF
ncbi:McrC family protein [Paenibacillus sp. CGMCC 1.18879]|uniref:McrC family protein n=1 Tax=Paenibacillus sp. CGMCC 1.18879 TaxID=2834466 RepID=UPI001CA7F527|nr:McrC family protein [Paenibacillus sp. CGMCC 1.18879]MBY9078941.1 hypothetical protein [Paenibacillus sp. CGMCC 1.18879]